MNVVELQIQIRYNLPVQTNPACGLDPYTIKKASQLLYLLLNVYFWPQIHVQVRLEQIQAIYCPRFPVQLMDVAFFQKYKCLDLSKLI